MIKARLAAVLCIVFWIGLPTAPCSIVPIPIFGTGLASNGAFLSGGSVDPHWIINGESPAYVVTDAVTGTTASDTAAYGIPLCWPVCSGVWETSTLNQWISIQPDVTRIAGLGPSGPDVTYAYRTTFNLTGLDSAAAMLSGRYTGDNIALGVQLNGSSAFGVTSLDPFTFQGWLNFTFTSGFLPGINTLDFVIMNTNAFNNGGPNPTGLLVEVSGTAEEAAMPEPATWGLLGLGLIGMWGLHRRRQRS